jgi:glycosyltransferase involved in cell wall biosynthesis
LKASSLLQEFPLMRFSIALATHNGANWLPRQLSSLLAQSRRPDELVAFDDASSDDTLEALRRFATESPFPVRVEAQSARVGAAGNFQSAIAAAGGDIIALCDQDDVWHPDKLARMEVEFAADPTLDLVFSDADIVDEDLQPLGYSFWQSVGFTAEERKLAQRRGLASVLVRFNVVSGAGMAFTARQKSRLLPIPSGWMHDGWIALILAATGRCQWIDQPLLAYRQHSRQQIGAGPKSLRAQIEIARRMDGPYFDRLIENFTACNDRLSGIGEVAPRTLDLIRDKIEHCRARRDMRKPGAGRVARITREIYRGRYGAVSLGFKSILQDALLA